MLEAYRATGSPKWLAMARRKAREIAAPDSDPSAPTLDLPDTVNKTPTEQALQAEMMAAIGRLMRRG